MDTSYLRRGVAALDRNAGVIAPTLRRRLVAHDQGWRALSENDVAAALDEITAALRARVRHGSYPPVAARRLRDLARSHRGLGPAPAQHRAFTTCLLSVLRDGLYDGAMLQTLRVPLAEAAAIMASAPDERRGPATWTARVLEVQRRARDVAVIRLHTPEPVPYLPGQHVAVNPRLLPGVWRRLWPSVPANPQGLLEFHVRVHPADPASRPLVATTREGDEWTISAPEGNLGDFDPEPDEDLLMIAGGTGVAPLRSIIYAQADLSEPPRTHLVFGAKSPGELHDLRTLAELARTLPHLTLTTAVEQRDDPPYTQATPYSEHPRAPLPWLGTAADVAVRVALRTGDPRRRRVLIGGGPEMIRGTVRALRDAGVDPRRIRHDPLD